MIDAIAAFLGVVTWVVIADALLSWFAPDPNQIPRSITSRLTAPLYAPLRLVYKPERMGGLDFSPIIVLIALHFLRAMLLKFGGGGG